MRRRVGRTGRLAPRVPAQCEAVSGLGAHLCATSLLTHSSGWCHRCSSGGGSGGQVAKDALGNDVMESSWLKTHQAGDRSLVQGLKVGALVMPLQGCG